MSPGGRIVEILAILAGDQIDGDDAVFSRASPPARAKAVPQQFDLSSISNSGTSIAPTPARTEAGRSNSGRHRIFAVNRSGVPSRVTSLTFGGRVSCPPNVAWP